MSCFFLYKSVFSYIHFMKQRQEIGLEFEIDKLTNSIQNIITGDSFTTEVILVNSISELKVVLKKNGWQFNWKNELKQPQREVL